MADWLVWGSQPSCRAGTIGQNAVIEAPSRPRGGEPGRFRGRVRRLDGRRAARFVSRRGTSSAPTCRQARSSSAKPARSAVSGTIGTLDVDILHRSSRKKSRRRAAQDSRTSESHSARTRASGISPSKIRYECRRPQDRAENERKRRTYDDRREKDDRQKDQREKENGAATKRGLDRVDACEMCDVRSSKRKPRAHGRSRS